MTWPDFPDAADAAAAEAVADVDNMGSRSLSLWVLEIRGNKKNK